MSHKSPLFFFGVHNKNCVNNNSKTNGNNNKKQNISVNSHINDLKNMIVKHQNNKNNNSQNVKNNSSLTKLKNNIKDHIEKTNNAIKNGSNNKEIISKLKKSGELLFKYFKKIGQVFKDNGNNIKLKYIEEIYTKMQKNPEFVAAINLFSNDNFNHEELVTNVMNSTNDRNNNNNRNNNSNNSRNNNNSNNNQKNNRNNNNRNNNNNSNNNGKNNRNNNSKKNINNFTDIDGTYIPGINSEKYKIKYMKAKNISNKLNSLSQNKINLDLAKKYLQNMINQ